MATAEGYAQDLVTRIINVKWILGRYVIISSTGIASVGISEDDGTEKAELLESRSQSFGGGAVPVQGSLFKCSPNAGDNFIKLNTHAYDMFGLEPIRIYVCPQTDEVRDNWWDYVLTQYDGDLSDDNGLPLRPFLWVAYTWSGGTTVMNFTIHHKPHLIEEVEGVVDVMTQAWPTSGDTSWPVGTGAINNTGYVIAAYRTDSKGTGVIYSGEQPSWTTDVVQEVSGFSGTFVPVKGLKFGTKPPLIAADKVIE